ncbi:MAG: hypothetical protein ABSG51_07445 [Terracidiphilus sp.]|jgi:hypothetical protein
MRTIIPFHASISRNRIEGQHSPACATNLRPFLTMAFLGVPLFLATCSLAAQTSPSTPAAQSVQRPVPTHVRTGTVHPQTSPVEQVTTPQAPPVPETPKWPVNQKPDPASVVWDSHGLRIDAANSSLQQILDDISTTTGAKVEGMDKDERVFGSYGPGQARDVLSQLLEGSGYNILMIGDQGQGTPRQIVLTVRTSGGPTQARTNLTADDDSDDEQPQQQDAPPGRTNFPRGPTPQQMEMQREQMRMRQQQQQGEQTGQPNQPNPPPN